MCYTPDIRGLLNLKKYINTELQLMLHMSVTGVTKLHICSMYW